jgi:hypothetical protein
MDTVLCIVLVVAGAYAAGELLHRMYRKGHPRKPTLADRLKSNGSLTK